MQGTNIIHIFAKHFNKEGLNIFYEIIQIILNTQ